MHCNRILQSSDCRAHSISFLLPICCAFLVSIASPSAEHKNRAPKLKWMVAIVNPRLSDATGPIPIRSWNCDPNATPIVLLNLCKSVEFFWVANSWCFGLWRNLYKGKTDQRPCCRLPRSQCHNLQSRQSELWLANEKNASGCMEHPLGHGKTFIRNFAKIVASHGKRESSCCMFEHVCKSMQVQRVCLRICEHSAPPFFDNK